MIVLVSGSNSYLRKKKSAWVAEEYLKKYGSLGYAEFDGSLGDVYPFISFTKNRPMFSLVSFASLKDIDWNTLTGDAKSAFISLLESVSEDKEAMVLLSSAEDPSGDFSFIMDAAKPYIPCPELTGKELISFIKKEGENKGIKLSPSEMSSIIEAFGSDLWAIEAEIDRFFLNPHAKTSQKPFQNIPYFELLNGLKFSSSPERKIIALEILLSVNKEDPARVFNGLGFSAPKGTPPEKWFALFADYDAAVKSGKMDYAEALLDFAAR